jgi:hypothetical protein
MMMHGLANFKLRKIMDFNSKIIRNPHIKCVVIRQRYLILKKVVRTISTMF